MNQLNNVPILSPAFNKNPLQLESSNVNKEKYQYILDVLTSRVTIQTMQDALYGFPEYAGYVALWGVGIPIEYKQGDTIVFFNEANGVHTGIHRVKAVPNSDVIILDTAWTGTGFFSLQTTFTYKIHRNKLPKAPDFTATFNVNGFSSGIVGFRFDLNDIGMFNIFENFTSFDYLANEEYFESVTGSIIGDTGGFATVLIPSRTVDVGTVVQLIQDTGTTYNGIWEVLDIVGSNMVLSAPFLGTYLGAWSINPLPKDTINDLIFADITEGRFAFNGSIEFPKILTFDSDEYDATITQPCKFLTTVPQGTKVKPDSKGYLQFFQSNKNTCSQYIVDVVDDLGVTQQYIVNLTGTRDNMLGISIGVADLNSIPLSSFDTVPARGLPVVQECDESYDVYLYGTTGCSTTGIQTVAFWHPMGQGVLNDIIWEANQWGNTAIIVQNFDIDGVAQPLFPTGNVYTQNDFTSQTPDELIYAQEIDTITGGVLNVVAPASVITKQNSMQFDIDFDKDFYIKARIDIQPSGIYKFPPPVKTILVEYIWDKVLCEWSYIVNGQKAKGGFLNIQGNGLTYTQLSEKINFVIDWNTNTFRGARLLFEDRLGSCAGFQFGLKDFTTLATSSDGFEQDRLSISRTEIDRGFTTIQISSSKTVQINSDWISQEEMNYLEEALTSPNVFIQIDGQVMPCIVMPATKRLLHKNNVNLVRLTMDVRTYGTYYSQRN